MAKNINIWMILGIVILVAVIASLITANITGNVISVCSSKTVTISEGKSFVFYDNTGKIPYKTGIEYITANKVILRINDQVTDSLAAGNTQKIDESASITINKIYYNSKVSGISYVSITFKYCPVAIQTLTYKGVLDVLSKCTWTGGISDSTTYNESQVTDCNQYCGSKTCINGFVIKWDNTYSKDGNHPIECNQAFNFNVVPGIQYICQCCSA